MMNPLAMWMILYGGWLKPPAAPSIEERMKAQAERFEAIEAQRVKNAINNPVAD